MQELTESSKKVYSYSSLGSGIQSSKFIITSYLSREPQIVPQTAVLFSPPKSTFWTSHMKNETAVIGANNKFFVLQGVSQRYTQRMKFLRSDVLAANLVNQNIVHIGCRNGIILSFDIRQDLRFSDGIHSNILNRKHEKAVYNISCINENFIVTTGLDQKINIWDLRNGHIKNFTKKIVQKPYFSFPNLNTSRLDLPVHINKKLSLLSVATDKNIVNVWNLKNYTLQNTFKTDKSITCIKWEKDIRPKCLLVTENRLLKYYM